MVIKFFKKLLLKKNKKLLSNFIKLFAIIFLLAIIVFMFIFSKTFSELISSEEYEKYDIWDGTSVASSFSGGNGTKDNPYQISSGSELMYFKNLIEGSSSSSYNTLYYKLTNNINLDGNDIQSIGIPVSISNYDNNTNIFKGTFDGNGYVIANGIFTTRNSSSNDYYGGLFAMTNNANITNLVLAKITITLSNVSNYNNIYIGTLAGAVLSKTNSIIQNCSIYDTTINITNNANIGGLIGYQDINSTLNGIYVNATITSSSSINKGNIVGYNNSTLDDNIKNSVIYSNSLENIYGYSALPSNFSSVYLYSYSTTFIIKKFEYNESLILSNSNKTEYDLASLLTANCNEKFNWVVYNDYIRFNNETTINKDDILINYSDSIFASKLSTNNTGIVGNVVYLNDIKKDYYYYMGLNYTTSDDGYMPSNENKKIYNDNNLVAVKLSYYGKNKENTLQGYVSTTEQQDTYIYYKLYNVNNNNTASLSDDYITIELSDNIFTDRPENKAFNGWITDYNGAKIYYDSTTYTRYVDVPITYSSSIPNTINLDMYSTWIDATISYVNSSSTWATAFSSLKSAGMQAITAYTYTYLPYDMSGYYLRVILSRGQSRVGYYSNRGVLYTSGTCTSTTCTYYDLISGENYNSELTYYYLNSSSTMTVLDPATLNLQVDQQILDPSLSGSVSGLYRAVTLNRYDSLVGYYDDLGNLQKSGTCSSATCTYYELIQYYDNYNQNLFNESYNYYYLVTRDINIVIMNGNISNTWSSTQNKPFTLTSVYNDTDYRSSVTWTVSSAAVRCYADTVIENIKIYSAITKTTGAYNPPSGSSSGNLYGNWFNLKVGRGITQYSTNYTNFASVMGGYASSVGSSSSVKKYKLIIESGVYNATSLSTGIVSTSYTMYIENKSIYGSDYDKAINNNSNLQVIYCASGSWGGIFYGATTTSNIFDLTVKSGSYGTNKYDYTTGIYVGGRYGGTHNAARKIVYEGGYSYNLIGGPLTNSNRTLYNDSYIYMTGGTVDMITAGAGSTATYGNRIVQVTGGLISYSIFGGSNGYQGTSGDGTVNGSSLVFVGGNATIGEESLIASSSSLYGATAGNVFGIGNGNSSYSTIGSNDNATVVIANEASVNRDVYGGGNYGTLGISSSYNTMEATIKIVGGTINGSIYGGGNNSGAGSTTKTATINIGVIKGTINGSIYGGSNAKGIVYGDSKLNIVSGTINGSIYGGGKGGYTSSSSPGTFVAGNIVLNLGSRNYGINPTILGTVYGGSAYGTVNGSTNTTAKSSKYVTVNYYTGNVGTIYGGGEGNATYTPYVEGNISVNVYGGKITNLYGGNNA
ncbi:MAG: hypothetical protein PHN42_05330, partial [Bacilli bacterium]|nr:hypothetical protein [Bacilli bacterium]